MKSLRVNKCCTALNFAKLSYIFSPSSLCFNPVGNKFRYFLTGYMRTSVIMMPLTSIFCCIGMLFLCTSFCKPHMLDDKKDRVVEKVLSDKEHFANEEHNKDYDHEAFLGEDAKEFDQLTPAESTRRLGIIVDKIDKDKDGFVSFEELREWIQYTQNKYLANDIESQWKTHNPNKNESLTWNQYKMSVYGISSDQELEELDKSNEEGFSYKKMLSRDRRRWDAADLDENGVLNRDEFAAFLHPEEMAHMRDLVVYETMEDIDKDGNGKISVGEYIGDMYQQTGNKEDEPDWVNTEREHFELYRDKNKDGYMDIEEVKDWILPTGFDHADAEARHLIYESDSNADQKLTKDEILSKYDLFVGSQATDFGEALARHDEF